MLAANSKCKDVVLILTNKGANLDHVNEVSVHINTLYYNPIQLELLYIMACQIKSYMKVLSII